MCSLTRLTDCLVPPQTKQEEPDGDENPFVMAVTVKDEDGNINLGAIAESEYFISIEQYQSHQSLRHHTFSSLHIKSISSHDRLFAFLDALLMLHQTQKLILQETKMNCICGRAAFTDQL